jgi:hypothetical protein
MSQNHGIDFTTRTRTRITSYQSQSRRVLSRENAKIKFCESHFGPRRFIMARDVPNYCTHFTDKVKLIPTNDNDDIIYFTNICRKVSRRFRREQHTIVIHLCRVDMTIITACRQSIISATIHHRIRLSNHVVLTLCTFMLCIITDVRQD